MDEAERLCDRVVLIDDGRVVATGTPAELTRQADGGVRLVLVTRAPLPDGWLDGCAGARLRRAVRRSSRRAGTGTRSPIDALPLAARVLERRRRRASSCTSTGRTCRTSSSAHRPRAARLMRAFLCAAGEGPAPAVARPGRADLPHPRAAGRDHGRGPEPRQPLRRRSDRTDRVRAAARRRGRRRARPRDPRPPRRARPAVRLRPVDERAEAERLVRDKQAGTALVIPRGTQAALDAGRPAVARALHRPGQVPRAPERARAPARAARRARVGARAETARGDASGERDRVARDLARLRAEVGDARRAADRGVAGRRARAAARGPRGAGRRSPAS